MANYRLSQLAEDDLLEIGFFSVSMWGEDQAVRYIDALEACCKNLVASPELGRNCDHIRPGLRRIEQGRHVVFYRIDALGIMVSRILHQRMLPERQDIQEELPE